MIRHVVMFRWVDGMSAEQVDAIAAGLDALPAQISEVQAYRHGPDAGLTDGNFDYVVVGDFATGDDYIAYRDHPAHRTFVAEQVAGYVAERAAVQYEIS